MKTIDDVREYMIDNGCEESVIFDAPAYATAFIGITTDGRAVYDYNKMVKHLMSTDNMCEDEAIEFIDYNTIRALPYSGNEGPIVIYPVEE